MPQRELIPVLQDFFETHIKFEIFGFLLILVKVMRLNFIGPDPIVRARFLQLYCSGAGGVKRERERATSGLFSILGADVAFCTCIRLKRENAGRAGISGEGLATPQNLRTPLARIP